MIKKILLSPVSERQDEISHIKINVKKKNMVENHHVFSFLK